MRLGTTLMATQVKQTHCLMGHNGELETLLLEHLNPSDCFYKHSPAYLLRGCAVGKNVQKIGRGEEVKPGEGKPFGVQVLRQGLLTEVQPEGTENLLVRFARIHRHVDVTQMQTSVTCELHSGVMYAWNICGHAHTPLLVHFHQNKHLQQYPILPKHTGKSRHTARHTRSLSHSGSQRR